MYSSKDNILSLINLFQKEKEVVDEIVKNHPASYLARVLQLKHEMDNGHPVDMRIQHTALYAGNYPWFRFLINKITVEQTADAMEIHPVATDLTSEMKPDTEAEVPDEKEVEEFKGSETGNGSFAKLIAEEKNIPDSVPQDEALHNDSSTEASEVNYGQDYTTNEEKVPDAIHETDPHGGVIEEMKEGKEPIITLQETPTITAASDNEVKGGAEVEPISLQRDENQTEHDLAFEPLHTIDYFASQGIKLTEADLSDDTLSRQVKSFTGWLRSMKRLHPGKLPEQDEVVQQIIQSAAEVSNTESDVLTEAMAEVLVKQNKKDKAIEMYQKLSLINPSKSAYFAAKIESLKIS